MNVAEGALYLEAILANCTAVRSARHEGHVMSSRGYPAAEITSHGTRCHDRDPHLAPSAGKIFVSPSEIFWHACTLDCEDRRRTRRHLLGLSLTASDRKKRSRPIRAFLATPQASAEIVGYARAAYPSAAAQTRIVSTARIRLDSRKSKRSFKEIICVDISE